MGLTSGVEHFFQSILEILQGILMTIVHAFQFVLNTIATIGKDAVKFVEGTLGFAWHYLFVIGTVAAVVFGYIAYQQRQGGKAPIEFGSPAAAAKKRTKAA